MKNKNLKLIAGLVFLGMIVMLVNWGWKFNSKRGKEEVELVAEKVARLMVLPEGQVTLATVTDAEKLASDNFFKSAKNGDKVLIYRDSGKAILYRPETDKIVDVAMVATANNNPASTNAELTQFRTTVIDNTPPKIAIYNGTQVSSLGTKMEKELSEQFPDFVINQKSEAVNKNYQQTIIVDVSGKYSEILNDLGTFLEAKVVNLPAGEVPPQADILIILGKDREK